MKIIVKVLLIVLIAAVLSQCKKEPESGSIVTIPDNNFLNALIGQGVDKNSDGIISSDEAAQVHSLNVS
jgi:hypothetical protein